MKKIISFLFIVVCIGMTMPSQAQIRFGVKGGLNLSKASLSTDAFKKDNFTGFFIGPMAEVTIPVVGLGVDGAVLFSQRGVKLNDQTIKQNGIDIPINLKYNIGLGSMLGIYLSAGPDFYFDFKKDESITWDSFDRKKAQVGLNLGAGVKLVKHLQVGVNWNMPLTDTAKFTLNNAEESYKTKTWQVLVAYMF
ncbi:MAG: porin family protein [Bacteroides sp.]